MPVWKEWPNAEPERIASKNELSCYPVCKLAALIDSYASFQSAALCILVAEPYLVIIDKR